MFTIKQPDSFALTMAEKIDRTSNDVLQAFAAGLMQAFTTLWYKETSQGLVVRPAAEVQRILDAFDNPSELFVRYEQNLNFMNQQAPGLFTPEQVAIPLPYTIDGVTGQVTVSDPPIVDPPL